MGHISCLVENGGLKESYNGKRIYSSIPILIVITHECALATYIKCCGLLLYHANTMMAKQRSRGTASSRWRVLRVAPRAYSRAVAL